MGDADGVPGGNRGADGEVVWGRLCGTGARIGDDCRYSGVAIPPAAAMMTIRTEGLTGRTLIENVAQR